MLDLPCANQIATAQLSIVDVHGRNGGTLPATLFHGLCSRETAGRSPPSVAAPAAPTGPQQRWGGEGSEAAQVEPRAAKRRGRALR